MIFGKDRIHHGKMTSALSLMLAEPHHFSVVVLYEFRHIWAQTNFGALAEYVGRKIIEPVNDESKACNY
jgi:hypothetical protein